MNSSLQAFARQQLKEGLAILPVGHQELFKRIYSHTHPEWPIEKVVDNMDESKLDWAMQQVENSVNKIAREALKPQ